MVARGLALCTPAATVRDAAELLDVHVDAAVAHQLDISARTEAGMSSDLPADYPRLSVRTYAVSIETGH